MELSIISCGVPSEPVSSLPPVESWVGAIVQRGASFLCADVDTVQTHVAVAAGLHQVDLS